MDHSGFARDSQERWRTYPVSWAERLSGDYEIASRNGAWPCTVAVFTVT